MPIPFFSFLQPDEEERKRREEARRLAIDLAKSKAKELGGKVKDIGEKAEIALKKFVSERVEPVKKSYQQEVERNRGLTKEQVKERAIQKGEFGFGGERPVSTFLRKTPLGQKITKKVESFAPKKIPVGKFATSMLKDPPEVRAVSKKIERGEPLTEKEKKIARTQQLFFVADVALTKAKLPKVKKAKGILRLTEEVAEKTARKAEDVLRVGGGKYNISDFDFSSNVKKLFKGVAEKSEDLIEIERRGKISFDETRKAANELFGSVEKLKRKRPGRALNDAEIVKAGDIAKTFFEKELAPLQKTYTEALKKGTATPVMKAQLLDKMNEAALIQSKVLGAASELGRGLNARKIIKQSLKDPTQLKIEKVLKQFGGAENTEKIIQRFNQLGIDDPTGKAAYKFLRSLHKPKLFEKLNWYWLNSILSGPRTQQRNILSNTLMIGLRPIDKVFSSVADVGRVATGKLLRKPVKRERFFGEAAAEMLGIRQGFVEGSRKFFHIMRSGYSLEDVGKLELGRPEPVGKVAGVVAGWPLRALSAFDQWAKAIIFSMESNALAYRKAAKKGVPLLERANRMTEILDDIPEDIVESASKATLKGTFQEQFATGSLAKKINKLRNWEVKGVKPLKFVLPFLQTPMNVAKVGLERAGVTGVAKGLFDAARKTGGSRSDAIGKALFAATTGTVIALQAWEGRVSGSGPKNKKDRDLLRETGWQPNSIRVTNPKTGEDTWVSYKGIAPLDQMFSQIASLHEQFVFNKKAPNEEKVSGFFFDILRNINNQTFMSGVADWLEAISNPESVSAGKFFTRFGASFVVPNIVRTVAQTQDRVLRQARTFEEQVKTGIPGISKQVEPRLSELGVPIVFEGSALLPFTTTKEKLPAFEARKTLAIKQNVRQGKQELKKGKFPTALDEGRANFIAAEFVYSQIKKAGSQEEESKIVKQLQDKGILNREVATVVDDLIEMEKSNLTKTDREMLLYNPGIVRAQMIVERHRQFGKPENAEKFLATLEAFGLLDEKTGEALRTLGKTRREKKEKAGIEISEFAP